MKRIPLMLVMALLSLTAAAQSIVPFSRPVHPRVVAKAPAKVAEQLDENGLIIAPATGVEKTFKREGKVLTVSGFGTNEGVQYGESKFVFCEDGTVYWNHPLCDALEATRMDIPMDTWVKGTLDGETITFPAGQKISVGSRPPYAPYLLYMCALDESGTTPDANPMKDEPIVLELSRGGKVMTLKNSSRQRMMGGFRSDNNFSIATHWDYDLTLIQDTSDDHAPAVTLPAGVQAKDYVMANHDIELDLNGALRAKIAIDGNDAYLGNFSYYGKGHWLKGTKQADGSLVFPKGQFISNTVLENDKSGIGYDLYAYGIAKGSQNVTDVCDLVFNYDATTDRYTAAQDIIINLEKLGSTIDYAERLTDLVCYNYPNLNDKPTYKVPAGYRVVTYDCHGSMLNAEYGGWRYEGQGGLTMQIAWAPDGKSVLMNGPLTWVLPDSWIKGTIEADGKLHVPTMQMVQDDEDMGQLWTGVFRYHAVGANYTYYPAPEFQEVVFSIDEDEFLYLEPFGPDEVKGKEPAMYIYGFYAGTDEFLWRTLGDAYTIYTPVEGSEYISGDEPGDEPGVEPGDKDEFDVNAPVAGEVRNEYGIITTPGTGTAKTYKRSGNNYSYSSAMGEVVKGEQSGSIAIVETADGIVYMQHPLSSYGTSYAETSWIKGKRQTDNTINFPVGQPVNFVGGYDDLLLIYMSSYDSADGVLVPNKAKKNIVFEESADGKTLTLVGSSATEAFAIFYQEDDAWVGYGDYNTVLTYSTNEIVDEVTEPSWKATKLNYTLTAQDEEQGGVGYNAILAFEGNTVYLGNFSFWLDYAHEMYDKYTWIKGTKLEDGSLFFPREQYLFTYQDYDIYFYGSYQPFEGVNSPTDLVFTYDAANDTYTAQQDIFLTWGRVGTSMNRAEHLMNVRLVRNTEGGTRPYIITEQPEGNLFTFARSGGAFQFINGNIWYGDQKDKEIDIVFSKDGKFVYMHSPISGVITSTGQNTADSWVSGTVDEDGNLHIPLHQWISYDEEVGYGARTAACILAGDDKTGSYFMVPNLNEFTFSFDPYTITFKMDRIEGIDYEGIEVPRLIYGAYFTNDNSWVGLGDFDSVYTPLFDTTNFDGFTGGGNEDGIKNVIAPSRSSNTYYDFAGRKTRATTGSMVIKDGKKTIVVK